MTDPSDPAMHRESAKSVACIRTELGRLNSLLQFSQLRHQRVRPASSRPSPTSNRLFECSTPTFPIFMLCSFPFSFPIPNNVFLGHPKPPVMSFHHCQTKQMGSGVSHACDSSRLRRQAFSFPKSPNHPTTQDQPDTANPDLVRLICPVCSLLLPA
ncbi:hypothetical protein GE21DRAFT_1288564 [Neurospora crassa]|nr:hypothetical protein GE21DRAFT_1288564 [Neurospora crassa]